MRGALIGVVVFALSACGPPSDAEDAGDVDAADVNREPCEADVDCDDGRFCNGAERCAPDDVAADARGCARTESACESGCDEIADRCVTEGCETPDVDGDGEARIECGGADCDDTNARRFSSAVERCDPGGIDEDCQPSTIAGLDDGDQDGDGFVSARCSNPTPDGGTFAGDDCDDRSASVFPNATENCNFIDDDCDGRVDEGVLSTYYLDMDGDGIGDVTRPTTSCVVPQGHVLTAGDCNDMDPSVNPTASEECNGVDDNCDGLTDPGCTCTDGETIPCGSSVGDCERGVQTCRSGVYSGCEGGVTPQPSELCGGGDEDCDGSVDEVGAVGRRPFFIDADGDGFGGATRTTACPAPDGSAAPGFSETDDDCVDDQRSLSAQIHPDADHHSAPHCQGSGPCTTSEGNFGCLVCFMGPCVCVSTFASWDYDCDGVATPQPAFSCSCPGFPCNCASGPTQAHTDSALCGQPVDYFCCGAPFGECNQACSTPTQPLPCR